MVLPVRRKTVGVDGDALRIAVLASGEGTNLQALLDAAARDAFRGRIVLVVSNRPGAGALERAHRAGVEALLLESRGFPGGRAAYDLKLRMILEERRIDLVCLAGWMRILTPECTRPFAGRMLNVHPALLPAHGGPGLFGLRVHEAVLASGDRESGATVHFVDEGCDTGPVVLQERVPVLPGDTPEILAERVRAVEHRIYPEAVRFFCEGRLKVKDGQVEIRPQEP